MKDVIARLRGERVEVRSRGFLYRGLLAGADEEMIYLKSETTWITLPMESVSSVRLEGASERDWSHASVAGEGEAAPAERESKRRYGPEDLKRAHAPDPEPEKGEDG